jgi:signal transduction histidine kinase
LVPAEAGPWHGEAMRHVWAFRLHDGRVVLARFGLMLHRPGWHVMMALVLVAVGVGIAALPIVARLTQRLERLRQGVERWGAGDLGARVPVRGQDEIAAVARSFNQAAERIEALLAAHRALLANASHELRSPLARLRVAAELMEHGPAPAAQAEVARNLAELDQLIDEILLASRLDHLQPGGTRESVELLALAAEEAARVGASAEGEVVEVLGEPRLLRRMLRNLLENAAKHGAPPVEVVVCVSAWKKGSDSISVQLSANRPRSAVAARRSMLRRTIATPIGTEVGGAGGQTWSAACEMGTVRIGCSVLHRD